MHAIGIEPPVISPAAARSGHEAFLSLADAASHYLSRLDLVAGGGAAGESRALVTRVRGTGPGGRVVRKDVEPGALAITVAPQRNMTGWVASNRPGTSAADAAAAAGTQAPNA